MRVIFLGFIFFRLKCRKRKIFGYFIHGIAEMQDALFQWIALQTSMKLFVIAGQSEKCPLQMVSSPWAYLELEYRVEQTLN